MQSVGKKRRAEIARRIAEIRGQVGGEPTAKAGIDPLPDLLDAFIRAADEQESLMIPVATRPALRFVFGFEPLL
jgi:hypothetical protein